MIAPSDPRRNPDGSLRLDERRGVAAPTAREQGDSPLAAASLGDGRLTYHYIGGSCLHYDRQVIAHGLCQKHYARLRRNGDPLAVTREHGIDLRTRFERHVIRGESCWEIPGGRLGPGYSTIWWKGQARYAHRVAYELYIGPIPAHLEIDHLCRNRACCYPAHLELVTHQQNMSRGYWASLTHCKNGHPFDAANTYRPPHQPTRRICRAC